jgi:hypothetical protein
MSSSRQRLTGTSISKHQWVSSTSNSSSPRTANTSGIATMSKNASMRSAGSVSPNCKSSSLEGSEQHDEEDTEIRSKPNHVWLEQHRLTGISTRDITTVNLVVTKAVFPKMKFVDRDTQLVFSNEKNSVYQFVISRCNLHTNISPNEWWKHTQKYVNQTINRLRNDQNTAMKWATLGKLFHAGYGSNKLTNMTKKLTVRSLCNKRLVPSFRQNHKDWKTEGHQTRIFVGGILGGQKESRSIHSIV